MVARCIDNELVHSVSFTVSFAAGGNSVIRVFCTIRRAFSDIGCTISIISPLIF